MERDGDEVLDTYELSDLELERQEVEKAIGKYIYYIDKGNSSLHDFFDDLRVSSPEEIIKIKDGLEEIKFTDFSVYRTEKYWGTYMDAKEVILPPKVKQIKGSPRLYILAYNGGMYNLPVLEYPKSIAPFLKWLKKKKKISYSSKPCIWNGDKTIYDKSGNLDWVEVMYNSSYGYPIKNLKTKEDISDYNTWLLSKYKPEVERYNKSVRMLHLVVPTAALNPTEIDITQADVDEFIDFWNNKYQVKR